MNETVCFRREFQFDPAEWPGIRGLKLKLESKMPSIEAWLNGTPLKLSPSGQGEVKLETRQLRRGRNVLAVSVGPGESVEEAAKGDAKQKRQNIRYGANLLPRPDSGDEVLDRQELEQLGLFRQLKKMPRVEEYPNSIVLRKYTAGDVICYQGEPGSSAFYILSTEDLCRLRCLQTQFRTPDLKNLKPDDLGSDRFQQVWDKLQRELSHLEQAEGAQTIIRQSQSYQEKLRELTHDLSQLEERLVPLANRLAVVQHHEKKLAKEIEHGSLKDADEKTIALARQQVQSHRRRATVQIIPGANRVAQPRSWLGKITKKLWGGGNVPLDRTPTTIRNDGPSDVDYQTRQAPMFEGDLFGEMACMTNTPRSATVTADRTVYMLEFLRNVFNLVQSDDGYREQILQKFRERVLSTHLDRLEFFQDLTPEQKATLSDALDLKIVDAGTVIFNEGEPSDCVYIIRTGLVQVVKGIRGVHVALNAEAVVNWREFAFELLKGDPGLEIPCPECGHLLRLFDRGYLGQYGRCPECNHKFLLKDPADTGPEIALTSADAYKTGKKKSAPGEKKLSPLEQMKAKAAAKKKPAGAEAAGEGEKKLSPLEQMKAKAAAKKKPAGAEAAGDKPASTADKIAAMKAGGVKKKTAAEPAAAKKAPAKAAKKANPHEYQKALWNALSSSAQDAIRRVASDEAQPQDEMQILVALNELIKSRHLADDKTLSALVANEPAIATFPRNKNQWTGLQICVAGRLILQHVYPKQLKKPADDQDAGPIRILAYLSSGDILGEMGVVARGPRSATCIAWDHPTSEKGGNRDPGQVHLISIKASAYQKLLQDPVLRQRAQMLIDERARADRRFTEDFSWRESSIITSPEFQDQGFIQGQKLMLIDLDACTRCGDCVRACINTHDDGYSRLFLDGPRFDRFLVPSACRNCIDPACMIGCPVGSIQKGEGGQIVIRDWCIGCEKCAKQCPYDSIQMHDTGVIPKNSPGWKFMPESAVESLSWHAMNYNDSRWSEGIAPFRWDLDFHGSLTAQKQTAGKGQSSDGEPDQDAPSSTLKYRDSVLEVRLDVDKLPPAPPGQESFDLDKLQLQALPAVAVVCDQCSTRKGGVPACVEHCPHEAAMRINARLDFPIGMNTGAS